jgi:tetratricopeptide (TPR) repeat protein
MLLIDNTRIFCVGRYAVAALVVGLVFMLGGRQSPALQVHSVQVSAWATPEEAEQSRARFAESCSPAFVIEDKASGPNPYQVLVGHFPYYVEAWIAATRMEKTLAPGAVVRSWEWDSRTLEATRLPIELPFSTDGLSPEVKAPASAHYEAVGIIAQTPPEAALLEKPLETLTREELLTVGIGAPRNVVGVPALERFLSEYASNPEAPRARLRLVRRLLGQKDFERAASLVEQVLASGTPEQRQVAALLSAYILYHTRKPSEAYEAFRQLAGDAGQPPSLRREAMRMAAGIAHARKLRDVAYLAFEQVERTACDPAVAAEARMQRAGLAFELVGCEKGSWDDARALCRSVETMPDAPDATRATARLMFAETFFKERNYDRAAQESDRLIADFPGVTRERVTAMYWKARSLQELHRADEALEVYAAIEKETITPEELFPALNVKARALSEPARIHRHRGNLEAARVLETRLLEMYPDSREARQLRKPTP